MPNIKISLITPTFNRKDELDYLIQSLARQTIDHQIFELIISDDGSTDGTEQYILEQAAQVDFRLVFIKQANQGPGAARNHGMENASGELFLFIDSDCEAAPDWIETIWRYYTTEQFDACGGPDGAKADFSALQKAIDYSMTSFFTTGGMRGHSEKMLAKFYPRSHNMGMTYRLYEQVGGFGSLRHGQDIELSHRIHSVGAVVRFIPDAIVYHRRRTSLLRFFKQVFNWGVARVNLGKISSQMLEPIHFLPAIAVCLLTAVLIGTCFRPGLFLPLIGVGLAGLGLLALAAGIKQHSLTVAAYALLTIPIQIIGYGAGFIVAFVHRNLLGAGTWTGFTKRYYN
ncbi:MAG: glycosyltransferase [Candidatus Neomarinimicrobiota bacterium]